MKRRLVYPSEECWICGQPMRFLRHRGTKYRDEKSLHYYCERCGEERSLPAETFVERSHGKQLKMPVELYLKILAVLAHGISPSEAARRVRVSVNTVKKVRQCFFEVADGKGRRWWNALLHSFKEKLGITDIEWGLMGIVNSMDAACLRREMEIIQKEMDRRDLFRLLESKKARAVAPQSKSKYRQRKDREWEREKFITYESISKITPSIDKHLKSVLKPLPPATPVTTGED